MGFFTGGVPNNGIRIFPEFAVFFMWIPLEIHCLLVGPKPEVRGAPRNEMQNALIV